MSAMTATQRSSIRDDKQFGDHMRRESITLSASDVEQRIHSLTNLPAGAAADELLDFLKRRTGERSLSAYDARVTTIVSVTAALFADVESNRAAYREDCRALLSLIKAARAFRRRNTERALNLVSNEMAFSEDWSNMPVYCREYLRSRIERVSESLRAAKSSVSLRRAKSRKECAATVVVLLRLV